jgi:transcriptional regulator of acetoin/glycerol metabolism
MSTGHLIGLKDLGLGDAGGDYARLDDLSLEEMECLLVKKALKRCDGRAREAAKALGLSRSALYRRLQRFGL